jgi:hypothetical protein
MTGLYVDNGQVITTHSMLKAFERCPKQADYKYHQRLKRRYATEREKPLKRGTWLHKLLEEHYAGRDWRAAHRQLTAQYNELFDDEKEALGDLPREILALMRSYLWHYGANKDDPHHGWIVHETEVTLECPWPDGNGIYRMRADALVEDEYGLWIVDHKSHVRLPDNTFRLRDKASALYIWCAQQNDIPVLGFIWNYIRAKAPTVPALVDQKRTPRLSKSSIDTDFPTAYRAIKEYGLDIEPHRAWLMHLKSHRWQPGAVQSSPFFRRDVLEKDPALINRVLKAAIRTRDRMHSYDFTDPDAVERVADRSCTFMCSYDGLCTVELFSGITAPQANNIRRQQYKTGDPLDYYQDQKDVSDEN